MSPRPPSPVTETELEVLRLLWQLGQATIRQLAEQLYPEGGRVHYATVQVLLDRLTAKNLVARHRSGRAHTFSALVGRGEFLRQRLHELAQDLCGGSLVPLLSHLVPDERLKPGEAEMLQEILKRIDEERS